MRKQKKKNKNEKKRKKKKYLCVILHAQVQTLTLRNFYQLAFLVDIDVVSVQYVHGESYKHNHWLCDFVVHT